MEVALNIAWLLCSFGMVWFWMRGPASDRVSRRIQVLALAMTVLLLLPVISLSDDLAAAQNPAETDSCLRRAGDQDCVHLLPVHPVVLFFPEPLVTGLHAVTFSRNVEQPLSASPQSSDFELALWSRPPPRV